MIHRANLSDLQTISDVLLEAFSWMEEGGTSLWTRDEISCESIRADVAAGCYYLLSDGGDIQATFMIQNEDSLYWPEAKAGEALYLHRIAVRRAFAGTGLTRSILAFVVEQARAENLGLIRLDCDRTRAGLNNLYTSLGFSFHSSVVIEDYHGSRYELKVAAGEQA
jgi:GNAT superfamily N-acetyltransferase